MIQDQNLATADAFDLVVYVGDPSMPKFPDVASPVAMAGPFNMPIGTGGGAFVVAMNFATPVSVAATEDVYVGLDLLTPWTITGGFVTDGLSVWECRGQAPASPQASQSWDEPGAGISSLSPYDRYGGFYCASPQVGPAYPVQTQFKIQPIVQIAGGVATAVTSQSHHPENTANSVAGFQVQDPGAGTASMFAGLYPDAAGPPQNFGRADAIGQMFHDPSLPPGSLVFFLIDTGGFGVEIPTASFLPGSTGVCCLNAATRQVFGYSLLGANGRAHHVFAFPPAVRPLLHGIDWAQQAIGFDLSSNTIHATACTRQRT